MYCYSTLKGGINFIRCCLYNVLSSSLEHAQRYFRLMRLYCYNLSLLNCNFFVSTRCGVNSLKWQILVQQSVLIDVYIKINLPIRLQAVCLLASENKEKITNTCVQHGYHLFAEGCCRLLPSLHPYTAPPDGSYSYQ